MSAVLGKWKSQIDLAVESGDRYTAHAYRSAVRAMSEEVGRVYRSFHAGSSSRAQIEPEVAYDALSRLSTDASVTRKQDWRSKAVASRLAQINHLAQKEDKSLAKRGRELEGARALTPSGPNQAPVASPDVIRDWLINQADMTLACHERARGKNEDLAERALCEHRYCKALFDSGAHEGDPWTASRTIRKAPAFRTQTSLRPVLRDAHRHLVQVMVDPNLRPAKPSAQSPISKPHLPVPMRSTGTRRQDLVKQVSGGILLSAEQVDELAYLARLADNQGHLGGTGLTRYPTCPGFGYRFHTSMGLNRGESGKVGPERVRVAALRAGVGGLPLNQSAPLYAAALHRTRFAHLQCHNKVNGSPRSNRFQGNTRHELHQHEVESPPRGFRPLDDRTPVFDGVFHADYSCDRNASPGATS